MIKIKQIKESWKYSHVRAIIWTAVICIVSGALSIALNNCCGAVSSILASICAGCVTGIVFYVITNMRNNEILATKEEFEEANKNYVLARRIMHLCNDIIIGAPYVESKIKEICSLTNKLLTYMGTLCFDALRTTKIIKNYPKEYIKKTESALKAIEELEKNAIDTLNDEQVKNDLMDIMLFCSATTDVLIEPWIRLMSNVDQFEKSVM